jgi:AhpD family alkylhydroperoxidase
MNDADDGTPSMRDARCFDKPIWTLAALAQTLPAMPVHIRKVVPTLWGHPFSNAFRERLMIAVATINHCEYCQNAHKTLGQLAGVTKRQLKELVDESDENLPEGERVALTFVRDLARRGFASRDEALYSKLGTFYSDIQRETIESTARVMNFLNRMTNTFHATQARLTGGSADAALTDLLAISAVFLMGVAIVEPLLGSARLLARIWR